MFIVPATLDTLHGVKGGVLQSNSEFSVVEVLTGLLPQQIRG